MKYTTIIFLLLLCQLASAQLDGAIAGHERKAFIARNTTQAYSVASNNYDVTYYRCRWKIDPAVRYISGSVTMRFRTVAAAGSIVLDMNTSLSVDSIVFRGARISFLHTGNHALQVNFGNTLTAGIQDSVVIYYGGVPANVGFGSFNLSSHAGVPVMWTLSEPYGSSTWWPCKDNNEDKPDSIDIHITHPSQYTASTNGLPINETVQGGMKTVHWKHRYPIAPYLVAVAITNYQFVPDAVTVGGKTIPVDLYAYPESVAAFLPATQAAKTGLQVFSSLFSEYPFSTERYAHTQFGWGGGMEHQTNSFVGSANSGLIAHELAHQWFGDKITCGSWQDLWLNEGFATYSENIFIEHTNPAARLPQLDAWRNNITNLPDGSVFIPDTTNISRMFNYRLTYLKAGYLLHMLRWILGDKDFFDGVKRYVNDPALAYRSARTAYLQRNLEAASGKKLDEFFKDWYKGEGYPSYKATWYQADNGRVRIKLDQSQSHPSVSFFEMPVPIVLRGAGREESLRLEHTTNGQVFSVNPGFKVDTLIIDPQLWLLTRNNQSVKSTTPIGISDFRIYPNPARDFISVAIPLTGPLPSEIRLMDMLGRIVWRQAPIADNPQRLDVRHYASGLYWVQLISPSINDVKPVLITRTD